jgi:hypothetical protein
LEPLSSKTKQGQGKKIKIRKITVLFFSIEWRNTPSFIKEFTGFRKIFRMLNEMVT